MVLSGVNLEGSSSRADSSADEPSSGIRRLWPALKWSLFAAVILFVGRRAYELWQQEALEQADIDFPWLILAGCAYVLGWLPSIWFWRRLNAELGYPVRFWQTARAYYCGHLGKYIPGKAMVLVIRAALVRDVGVPPGTAALTATCETLVMMGTGGAVALALAPWTLGAEFWDRAPALLRPLQGISAALPVVVPVLGLIMLPLFARTFSWAANKLAPRPLFTEPGTDSAQGQLRVSTKLLLQGALAFTAAWACHGMSLGLTLHSLTPGTLQLADWPLWTAAASFATVAGFVILVAPGGLGVREGLIMAILQQQSDASGPQIVVAAVLLRVVWLMAEILASGLLYYAARPPQPEATRDPSF